VAADVRPHGDSPNIAQRSLTPGFVVSALHTFTGPIRTIELDIDPLGSSRRSGRSCLNKWSFY